MINRWSDMSSKSMSPNDFSEKAENTISEKNESRIRCFIKTQKYLQSFSSNVELSTYYCPFGFNGKKDVLNVTRRSYVRSNWVIAYIAS